MFLIIFFGGNKVRYNFLNFLFFACSVNGCLKFENEFDVLLDLYYKATKVSLLKKKPLNCQFIKKKTTQLAMFSLFKRSTTNDNYISSSV